MQDQTTVQQLSKLYIANDNGVLRPALPYQLFGPLAMKGSNFYVGSNEWLNKPVTQITLEITWLVNTLPKNFGDYYKSYAPANVYGNDSFRVNCSVLNKGTWYLLNPEPLNLFETDEQGTLLLSTTLCLQISQELLTIDPSFIKEPVNYNPDTVAGFMKMELVAPDHGFGTDLYVTVLSDAVQNKTTLPFQPYSPRVDKLKVSMC
jgi:hypothetical protein